MAEIFTCRMTEQMVLKIKAESKYDAEDWMAKHTITEARELAQKAGSNHDGFCYSYSDEVLWKGETNLKAIDITDEENS